MNAFKDWWPLLVVILGWIITAAMQWTTLKNKINGLGGRVRRVEESCAASGGRMDRFEKELSEYRNDARSASNRLSHVDKGVSDLAETVRDGNIALGVQLGEINKTIAAMDKNLGNRLTRVETVQKIEQKIGPIPTE